MPKITVSVSKTVQENQYEPCTILLEQESRVPEGEEDEYFNEIFTDLNERLNIFFEKRRKNNSD